jgi:hypothetical protein
MINIAVPFLITSIKQSLKGIQSLKVSRRHKRLSIKPIIKTNLFGVVVSTSTLMIVPGIRSSKPLALEKHIGYSIIEILNPITLKQKG